MSSGDFIVFAMRIEDGSSSAARLQICAHEYLGAVTELDVARGEWGKPYFPQRPDVNFSISHSGDYWVCAFGTAEVGIDVQQQRPVEAEKLTRRFFHPDEYDYLMQYNFDSSRFYSLWAAKEAVLKYSGQGLTQGMDTFSVLDCISPCWRELDFAPGYTMCIAAAELGNATILRI